MRWRLVGIGLIGVVLLVLWGVIKGTGTSGVGGGEDDAFGRGVAIGKDISRQGFPSSLPSLPLYSNGFLDDSGYNLAYPYTRRIRDRSSLAACLDAARGRTLRGVAALQKELKEKFSAGPEGPSRMALKCRLEALVAVLYMYDGDFAEADPWIERAIATASAPGVPPDLRANLVALRGVNSLRQGELDNCIACLGPSSCIFPIEPEARHQNPDGSRRASRYFTEYLRQRPEDLGVRWLLNIAAMTVGEYPDGVPKEFVIPLDSFRSTGDVGRFRNVAPLVGLNTRGPNMSGGSLFDDFTGDGLPDVLTTTTDWDRGASFFVNRGDGTFEDRSVASGLDKQPMALNAAHADFDNDGKLDVVILRGGWEEAYPLTLLRNTGEGRFEDVTAKAGLSEPIASQSAAWGDYDNDGHVDLFVCGEYNPQNTRGTVSEAGPQLHEPDPRNLCRLYHNNGDGTFTDVAPDAGVINEGWAKGAVWGDYNDDGRPDLYVSNLQGANRLYRNNGDGTFTDVASELGVSEPKDSFACWFWDYDNDGRQDLFVCAFRATLHEIVSDALGRPAPDAERPRLFRNLGPEGFADVTKEVGLDRVWVPMGSNFGDVDNDGFLDVYLATGRPPYSTLVPNVMLHNAGGRRFEDVTTSSGTGHLQKGHGVSFADYDRDGDLDLFVEMGGATPGDKAHNLLFRNPGHGRHWLEIKLVGTKTNRAALGAKVRVDVATGPGATAGSRSVYRQISGGSSFGGNSLAAWVGLGDATSAATVTITWPTSKTTQTFHDVPADRSIEITEGATSFRTRKGKPLPEPPEIPAVGRSEKKGL